MIESCSKKRMLLGISLLGGLTILVLIVESHWTDNSGNNLMVKNTEPNFTCPSSENFKIIEECVPCTAFELASQSSLACKKGKFKEVIKCDTGEKITRSCDKVAWLEEKAFWQFESLAFVGAVLSCAAVFWRENILRQKIIRKVARQLRGSV